MRYILTVILSVCSVDAFNARPPASSFIRPHTRFMIQSVVNKRVDDTKDTQSAIGKFCKASGSLVDSSGQPLDLFSRNSKSLSGAFAAAETLITDLAASSQTDDFRRLQQFKEAWEETIVGEIGAIAAAAKEMEEKFTLRVAADETMITKSDGPETQVSTVNGIHAILPKYRDAEGMVKQQDEMPGVKPLPKDAWEALKVKDESLRGILSGLVENLGALESASRNLFTDALPANREASQENSGGKRAQEEASKPSPVTLTNLDGLKGSESAEIILLIARRSVANKDGKKECDEKFKEYVGAGTLSHADRLTRLTTALNILHMRRLGLSGAKGSSTALDDQIKELFEAQTLLLAENLKVIHTALNNKESDSITAVALKAFQGALTLKVDIKSSRMPDEGAETEHLDNQMGELAKFIGKDASGEFVPQLELITNSLWRLHAHIWGFIKTYTPAENEPHTSGYKLVNNFNAFVSDLIKARAENVAVNAEKPKAFAPGARDGANCLLYGRVDSLLRHMKLRGPGDSYVGEKNLCTEEFHNLSVEAMKKLNLTPELLIKAIEAHEIKKSSN